MNFKTIENMMAKFVDENFLNSSKTRETESFKNYKVLLYSTSQSSTVSAQCPRALTSRTRYLGLGLGLELGLGLGLG